MSQYLPDIIIGAIIIAMLLFTLFKGVGWRTWNQVFSKRGGTMFMDCKKCGQVWEKYHFRNNHTKYTWLEFGPTKKTDCICHDLTNCIKSDVND